MGQFDELFGPGDSLPQDFEGYDVDTDQLIDPHDPSQNRFSADNGLSDFQRNMLMAFLDTPPQKNRRRAYLKQLGFEMSKDGDGIRPLTNPTGEFEPIDPSFGQAFKEGGVKGVAKEFWKDLQDIQSELVTGGLISAGATAFGSAGAAGGALVGGGLGGAAGTAIAPGAGTALGAGIGTAVVGTAGGISGAILGGASGNAVAEIFKKGISDYLTDDSLKDVPMKDRELVVQSFIAGGLNKFGQMGANQLKKTFLAWRKRGAKGVQESLMDLTARKGEGVLTTEVVEDVAKFPEKYSRENLEGAGKRINELFHDFFGTSVGVATKPKQLSGGLARRVIEPINERARLEIEKLAKDPAANVTVQDLVKTFQQRMVGILGKRESARSGNEVAALKFMDDKVDQIKKDFGIKDEATGNIIGFEEINYKEANDILKSINNAVLEEGPFKGNASLGKVAKELRDSHVDLAGVVGSDYPKLRKQQGEIIDLYNKMRGTITPTKLSSAFTGTRKESSGVKQEVLGVFDEMDKVLGTETGTAARSRAFEATMADFLNDPRKFGTGRLAKDMTNALLTEVPKSTIKGITVGSLVGQPKAGGILGGISGVGSAARRTAQASSPERLLKSFSKINTKLSDIDKARGSGLSVPAQVGVGAVAPKSEDAAPFIQETAQAGGELLDEAQQQMGFGEAALPEEPPKPDFSIFPEGDELPEEFSDFDIEL